ncbi:MAG: hypothetical protein ABH950_06335 [Candidatus Altiarchaeota archaeon]
MRQIFDLKSGKKRFTNKSKLLFITTVFLLIFVLSLLISVFVSFFMISVILSLIQPHHQTIIRLAMIPISYLLGIYTHHQYERLKDTLERKHEIQRNLGKLRFGYI